MRGIDLRGINLRGIRGSSAQLFDSISLYNTLPTKSLPPSPPPLQPPPQTVDSVSDTMKQTIFTVLAFAAFASACPVLVTRAAPCAPVHIIAARASGEAPGEGIIGSLIAAVIEESTQEITTAVVDYPATLSNYASSSAAGTKALTAQLTAQVAACPLQKIVLVGYSQGAHVIGDTLAGGGGGSLGPKTQPVAASVAANGTYIHIRTPPLVPHSILTPHYSRRRSPHGRSAPRQGRVVPAGHSHRVWNLPPSRGPVARAVLGQDPVILR